MLNPNGILLILLQPLKFQDVNNFLDLIYLEKYKENKSLSDFEQAYINELQAWADELETGIVNHNFATHKDALIANETAQMGADLFK